MFPQNLRVVCLGLALGRTIKCKSVWKLTWECTVKQVFLLTSLHHLKGLRKSQSLTQESQEVNQGFSSVVQSCPTLCNPMNCSMQGFPVHHQPPELAQTHVHPVGDAMIKEQQILNQKTFSKNQSTTCRTTEELEEWKRRQATCTCEKKKSRVQANSMLRIASSWPNSEKAKAAQLWNQLLKAKDNLRKSVTWQRLLIQSLIHIFPLYFYHTDDYSAHIFIPRVNVFDILFLMEVFW